MPDAVTDDVDTGADDERTSAPAKPKAKVPRAPFIVVAVTVLLLGIAVAFRAQNPMEEPDRSALNGTMLGAPQPRPEFTLTDTDGRPYDFADETAGELTLLFFGYTSCPDVCPLHLSNLAFALERPGVPTPTVVFVGVDRQRGHTGGDPNVPGPLRPAVRRPDGHRGGAAARPGGRQRVGGYHRGTRGARRRLPRGPLRPGHRLHRGRPVPRRVPLRVRQQDWIDDLPVLARNEWDET
ncbi:SCO family protein [Iamia sp. SCSIO 61187]|nr:SCO family protein [Iamia sp. SCSIO 61187]QYG94338.1 SCO family protein [Iamia sp. SCSIO 61187]